MKREHWTIRDYLEELVCICEILEVPGMKNKLENLKTEICQRFSQDERESVGLLF
jgi:hypothetical protein